LTTIVILSGKKSLDISSLDIAIIIIIIITVISAVLVFSARASGATNILSIVIMNVCYDKNKLCWTVMYVKLCSVVCLIGFITLTLPVRYIN